MSRPSGPETQPRGVRRVVLLGDAVRRLGLGWLMFRTRYWVERRAGVLERRSPRAEWPELVRSRTGVPTIVAADTLRRWLESNTAPGRRAALRDHVESMRRREFDVFGRRVELSDWHDDPLSEVRYDPDRHWSHVPVPEGVDVKLVWEPSRFGWAFDLARAHLLDADSGAADVFWELLDEWCEQNPPNSGVNWSCGQESSIRLVAAVSCASAMRDSVDAERASKLQRLAWATGARVEANIAYARSQRNNHHASEAVGLLTAGLLFPYHSRARRWHKLAEEHLREVCETLVFEDGGTSQYSTNYHRVFVHDLVWAVECYRYVDLKPPPWLATALERTTAVLEALVEPISGSGPFFGHDDGGRVLPLADVPHRNLEQDAILARAATQGRSTTMLPRSEGCAWFGLADPPERDTGSGADVDVRAFPEFGLFVLAAGPNRAFVRAGSYRYRPAQDDLLHCDLWLDGNNVAPDSGTASYAPQPGEPGMLDTADFHNGPRQPGAPLMERASRFLWSRWPAADAQVVDVDDGAACGVFSIGNDRTTISRTVRLTADCASVTDSSSPAHSIVCAWRLPEDEELEGSGWTIELSTEDERPQTRDWSHHYGSAERAAVRIASTTDGDLRPLRLNARRTREREVADVGGRP